MKTIALAACCVLAATPNGVAQAPTNGFASGVGGVPGVDGFVHATVVFDDGTGPALYVGGDFLIAGGVAAARVARFDGVAWSAVGAGFDAAVRAFVVHDDGAGPALYAGGSFTASGGAAVAGVARWSPASGTWAGVGGGVGGAGATVHALTSFAATAGAPATLYAGGAFASAGGVPATNVAAWNGSVWSALGNGVSGVVHALAGYAGAGAASLYAGGAVYVAGNPVPNVGLRSWNGAVWSTVAGGLAGVPAPLPPGLPPLISPPVVRALAVHDEGAGPKLFVGGTFSAAGGVVSPHLARFDGAAWSSVGGGLSISLNTFGTFGSACAALTTVDLGAGPRLAVVGAMTSAGGVPATSVALWDGAAFAAAPGVAAPLTACAVGDLGAGTRLFVGGAPLTAAGGRSVFGVAAYDGAAYAPLGAGVDGVVMDAVVYDDGAGPKLHVCTALGVGASGVFRREAVGWARLGGGFSGGVRGLAVYDYGIGPRLFASGDFSTVDGAPVAGVAEWNGAAWVATPGAPLFGRDLAVYDDGAGPRLYVVGTPPGAAPTRSLARYDGAAWIFVGGPLTWSSSTAHVHAMAVHDDGAGPRLFCAGEFTHANGATVNHVAAWDGSAWSALAGPGGPGVTLANGSGTQSAALALAVHDALDGRGPLLYVSGAFALASGVAADDVAVWDGQTWGPAGVGGTPIVVALASFDDGAGGALYALTPYGSAHAPGASGLAKLAYGVWSNVATFGGFGASFPAYGQSLTSAAPNGAPELWIGGYFGSAGGVPSPRVAQWTRSAPFLNVFAQPGGAGSFRLDLVSGPGGRSYFTALSFDPANAAAPRAGYWRGLHLPLPELLAEFALGAPPFVGGLDAAGNADFELPTGTLPPWLAGATLYGVTHAFDGATGEILAHTEVFSAILQ